MEKIIMSRNYIKISTQNNKYIYDVGKNEILQVNNCIYELIDHIDRSNLSNLRNRFQKNFDKKTIQSSMQSIKEMQKLDYFTTKIDKSKYLFNVDNIDFGIYDNKIEGLDLEINQDCNLRCRYCIHGNRYKKKKSYSKQEMSFDLAKKCIDFYFQHSSNSSKVLHSIAFAGGEPLLNFRLIKSCIEYTKSNYSNFKLGFQLTTNGILLKREILDFLIKNDTFIAISLDGPKEVHDRQRIFPDGKGTYNIIRKNLLNFKKKYPKHYLHFVMFLITIEPPYNLEKRFNFFRNDELVAPHKKRFTFTKSLNTFYSKDEIRNKRDFNAGDQLGKEIKNIILSFTDDMKIYDLDPLIRQIILRFKVIHEMTTAQNGTVPIKACLPGKRLFIDVHGKFHVCYSAVTKNSDSIIGDIEHGFDLGKVHELFEIYKNYRMNILKCTLCNYIRFCNLCLAYILTNSVKENKLYCEEFRNSFYNDLKTYLEIIEQKPNAFDLIFSELI